VLITAPKGPLYDKLIALNIKVYFISGVVAYGHCNGGRLKLLGYPPLQSITRLWKIPKTIRLVRGFLQKHPVDLVYVNSSVLWTVAFASKGLGIKTIIHIREQISNEGLFGIRRTLFRKILEKYSDKLIVLTKASKSQYLNQDKIRVIYNAVDKEDFLKKQPDKKTLKRILGLPEDGNLIIYVGGALRHKGFEVLLKAFRKISQTEPKVYLLVLGNTTSPYLPTNNILKRIVRFLFLDDTAKLFQTLVVKTGLEEKIIQVGSQENVHDWLSISDILIFPSTLDHFGRPIIEALALGIPVIASDLPSNNELVQMFQEIDFCKLFENQNDVDLAKIILQVLTSERKGVSQDIVTSLYSQYGLYSDFSTNKVARVIENTLSVTKK